jgi:hypothetical protein
MIKYILMLTKGSDDASAHVVRTPYAEGTCKKGDGGTGAKTLRPFGGWTAIVFGVVRVGVLVALL